jgi:nitrate/nitrite-specific signal transduction histidine kinase
MFTAAAPPQNPGRGPVWTPPFRDPAGQGLLITAAVPVYDREGNFHAVAGVNMSLDEVLNSVLAVQSRTLLSDDAGSIIAASRQALAELGLSAPDIRPGAPLAANLRQVQDQELRAALEETALSGAEAGVRRIPGDAQNYLLAHARLPTTGWTLLMFLPEEEVLAGAQETATAVSGAFRELRLLVTLGIMLLGLLVLVASPGAARWLTGPLERLATGTRKVAAGDLSFRLRPEGKDEIGMLAGEFNRMAERLQGLYTGLEQNVRERTEALTRSTARLRALHVLAQEIAALGERDLPLPGHLSARIGQVCGYDGAGIRLEENDRTEVSGWGTLQGWLVSAGPDWPPGGYVLRFADLAGTPAPGWPAAGSAIAVPVPVEGETRGWLAVHMQCPGELLPEDEESLATLAGHLAVCLENRRLLRQAGELAVVEERNRMAREIHDTLAQGFTGVLLQLEAAEQVSSREPDVARRHLEQARQLAREGLAEARRSVWNLRPAPLVRHTLVDALAGLAGRLEAEGLAVEANLERVGLLPPTTEVALLRVAQEALHNIRRHAHARRVRLVLASSPDTVSLVVADDGCGMVVRKPVGQGFGLPGMEERLAALGGKLIIESAPGKGTLLRAEIPRGGKE